MSGRNELGRRVARPWRWAFVAYAVALTAGTHWPELTLGTVEDPFPDKLVHMLAFAGLTIGLALTGWLPVRRGRPPGRLREASIGAAAAAWTILDEVTQSLPGLGRTFSLEDLAAGLMGVGVALVWLRALGPLGGTPTRTRLAWQACLLGALFLSIRSWLLVGLAAAAGAAAAALVIWVPAALVARLPTRDALAIGIATAFVGGLAGAHLATTALVRRRARAVSPDRPCFGCGSSCRDAVFDEFGRGRCPGCGDPVQLGQWRVPMDVPGRAARRGALRAAGAALGLLLVAAIGYAVVLFLASRVGAASAALRWWSGLSWDLRHAVDLAAIAVVLAIATRIYRVQQARIFDLQDRRCRACGHDVSATPLDAGCGVCGECGTAFVRFPRQPDAVAGGPGPD